MTKGMRIFESLIELSEDNEYAATVFMEPENSRVLIPPVL
jgi:hypothetical protein